MQSSQNMLRQITALMLALALAALSGAANAQSVSVTNASELRNAVDNANGSGGNVAIELADGTYTLSSGLYISSPGVTIRSASGNRDAVIIEGDAMSSSASVGVLVSVAADNFTLDGVTLQKSRNHLIQVRGETDADNPVIRNCRLRDAYEQIIKVSVDLNNLSVSSDNGIVENCIFEYTAGIGPQFYIGGIDAHAADDWVVRDNEFHNIISPNTTVAEYAVHFWNGSSNTLVERNLIVDCDRGIGFGLNSRGNTGGVIRNNMIYHADNRGSYADVGIAVHNSPDTEIYNNTIFMEHSYPNAIEYRFEGTTGVSIVNNLVNKSIRDQSGATGSEQSNVENAQGNWFVNPGAGDLHLSSGIASVVDQGQAVTGLTDDFDGDARAPGSIDIGADEFSSVVRPMPPADFTSQ